MGKYEIRIAIAQLVSVLGAVGGLYLADQGTRQITKSIEALGNSDYLAGSSEQFGLALLSVLGGGLIAGFFLATTIAIIFIAGKDANDNRPRRPLRNR